MCRPIESRDSLGAMGPAAVLFAGDQGSSESMVSRKNTMTAWALASGDVVFGGDNIDMLSMAALPPALPFVSLYNKDMPNVPWGVNTLTTSVSNLDLPTNLYAPTPIPFEVKAESTDSKQNFDTMTLEKLLDFSLPDDMESVRPDYVDLDAGFDGLEMSILYSFLVDTPDDKPEKTQDGILNSCVLMGSPIEGLIESLEPDFTDTEPTMTSCHFESQTITPDIGVKRGKAKSRRLCKSVGCFKRSRSNGRCISHGGGRRCAVDGCDKSSQGGNLCIRHGGGKRCSHEYCDKAAQSNFLCKAHGGGPRCQYSGCSRSSQGGGYCRSHGGGKRCMSVGCGKGTQRGDYCALHGGSRLCEVPGCLRNDRGGGICATHGGGKRCTVDGCIKPCRRRDLCSAHLRQTDATVH